jgi:hypothetical protein
MALQVVLIPIEVMRMRFPIGLALGVAIGYGAFAPEMDSTRKDLRARVNALIDNGQSNSSNK